MSSVSLDLARSNLFKTPLDNLTQDEKISLGYQQARAAARAFGITIDDILNLTPKFWAYHSDPIHGVSYASLVLVTIQYNLVAGTIGPYLAQRPDLKGLMESVMNFDVNGQFLLTEIGHGLDTQSIETTATLLDDGCFDLHSPTPEAAKYMPPTTPVKGFPRFALVIARLIVAGEFHGLRAFIVWLNDGERMNNGVTSKRVPNRLGAKPIDHSITFFNHVRLPSSALLGSIEKPKNMRTQFLSVIWRVMVGSLSLPTMLVPLMKRAVYVAGKYSIRRHIHDNHGGRVPIISFRTQQQPILHTLAKTKVFEPFIQECIRMFRDPSLDKNVRHGIGAIAKAVLCSAFQESLFGLAERCGSQGLFHYNHIIENYMEGWGASIAEGDVLVLCIRLATELLLRRYKMPESRQPTSLIARHENGMFEECDALIKGLSGSHRGPEFNNAILPRCKGLIEAIGQRMAYEAASEAQVDPKILALYEAGVILHDSGWYIQNAGLTREVQFENESRALSDCLPQLEDLLDETGVAEYVNAPILSKESWDEYVSTLVTFESPPVTHAVNTQLQCRANL